MKTQGILLMLSLAGAAAFQPGARVGSMPRALKPLNMAAQEKSMNKDGLIYDPRTGRFYEKSIEEVCRDEFCTIDETTGEQVVLSVKEKERIFLDSLQAYYYDGSKVLNDDDFDQLKADLVWEGSPLATLNREETLFLNAMGAYMKGKPIISDAEFDALKAKLKEEGSMIAVATEPKCYVDTGVCKVTFVKDEVGAADPQLPVLCIGPVCVCTRESKTLVGRGRRRERKVGQPLCWRPPLLCPTIQLPQRAHIKDHHHLPTSTPFSCPWCSMLQCLLNGAAIRDCFCALLPRRRPPSSCRRAWPLCTPRPS
uniref:Uncharacterized protein n=1 Tax=Heterosigma akashiwo TaxID=2829 RepID=A0A7S3UUH2_HETAK